MHMPSKRYCTYEFMMQVLTGQKCAFKKEEIMELPIRQFRELRMNRLLANVLPHAQVEKHLPDKNGKVYRVE